MKSLFLFIFLTITIFVSQAQTTMFRNNNNNRSLSTNYLPFPSALNFKTSLQNYAALPPAVYFSGDFSIECWVYLTATTNWSRIIDFGNGAGNNCVLFSVSGSTSGSPALHVGGYQFQATGTVPLNQWTHLAATLSGINATIYINGIASGTSNLSVPANVTRSYNYIGRSNWGWGDPAPEGSFDDLRIWSVAKTGPQLLAAMNSELTGSEPNLVAYFKFNEGIPSGNNTSITTLINSALTGSMYNATLYNFSLTGSASNYVIGKF
jgi:Concanavalin A-like lectin/glucanases superfamily